MWSLILVDCMYSSPSCSIPIHFNDSIIWSLYSSFDLSLSVSSILKWKVPFWFFENNQLNRAVLTPPMWSGPVGDGANLVATFDI